MSSYGSRARCSVRYLTNEWDLELQPGLGNFWRSRPIAASSWFWVKFAFGLIAVQAVLDRFTIALSWNSPYPSGSDRKSWSCVDCMPLTHAMLYALAVFGVCRLRRPALGAMLSDFFLSILLEAFSAIHLFDPTAVYNGLFLAEKAHRGAFDLAAHRYPLAYGAVASIIVLAAFSAFRAIRSWNPASGKCGSVVCFVYRPHTIRSANDMLFSNAVA
jgi:hypothetical protein